MKKLLALLFLLFSCGGASSDSLLQYAAADDLVTHEVSPDEVDWDSLAPESRPEPEGDIGTLEQALTWPVGYGTLKLNPSRCWDSSGDGCLHPNWANKTFRRRFQAGSCSSWFQARFVSADGLWTNTLSSRGWTIQVPDSNGKAKWYWHCKPASELQALCNTTNALGCTAVNWAQDASGNGVHTGGNVYIFPEKFEAQASWAGKTDAQKERFATNILLHELYHSVGLGHSDAMLSSTLMVSPAPTSFYDAIFSPVTQERTWLNDFQP